MARGFYVMHRGWMENAIFPAEPYTRREAFLWLIERAAWDDSVQSVGRRRVSVQRGQLAVATRYLGGVWQWGNGKVQRFLETLKSGAMIETQVGADYTLITICNYRRYQDIGGDDGAPLETPDGAEAGRERGNYKDNQINKINQDSETRASEPVVLAEGKGVSSAGPDLAAKKEFVSWMDEFLAAPKPYALTFLTDWLGKGASLDLVREVVIDLVERKRSVDPDWYPGSLKYFNDEVLRRLARPARMMRASNDNRDRQGISVAAAQGQWQQRVSSFKASGFWMPLWGDQPDQPDCLAPPAVLREYGYR